MKVSVVETGYMGLSNATLRAQHHEVVVLGNVTARVNLINARKATVIDAEIENFLEHRNLNLRAMLGKEDAYRNADFLIIATHTDYDAETNYFNTDSVEAVIRDVMRINPSAVMVIKSTAPVWNTDCIISEMGCANLIFSPEFLREGKALYDNLHPSCIIVGERSERATVFAALLAEGAQKNRHPGSICRLHRSRGRQIVP